MHNFKDILGQKFGRLTVIRQEQSRPRKHSGSLAYWTCLCDCGKETSVSGVNLRQGQVSSCGCLRLDSIVEKCTTHGLSQTNNHYMWVNAKQRAKKLGLNFNIEPTDIVIPDFCPVLGIRLEKGIGKLTSASPSVDRIFPERGYIKGNIRVISHRANLLKSNATTEELEKVLDDSRHFELFTCA